MNALFRVSRLLILLACAPVVHEGCENRDDWR